MAHIKRQNVRTWNVIPNNVARTLGNLQNFQRNNKKIDKEGECGKKGKKKIKKHSSFFPIAETYLNPVGASDAYHTWNPIVHLMKQNLPICQINFNVI